MKYCKRSLVISVLMLWASPWLFWLGQDWPAAVTVDPSAYAIVLAVWVGILLLFVALARTPGRWTWPREFCIGLFIAVVFLVGVDHLPMVRSYGDHALIFQPGTTVRYESAEFHITAVANNLGFRDRDFSIQHPARGTRILVIGDSFVYGWGVPVEASWPKILEKALPSPVEVANLGQPGASPWDYANLAERAIPLLHPDAVLVGISESNDLWQSVPSETPTVFRLLLQKPLKTLFPNLADMLYQRRHPHEFKDLHPVWQDEANGLLAHMDATGQARFAALAADVQDDYRKGEINPSELWSALSHPTDLTVFEPGDPVVQIEVDTMAQQLRRMARVCSRVGCPMLVVGIPAAVCVNRPAFEGQKRAGFELDARLLDFDGHDEAVGRAAQAAQVQFWSAVPDFRAQKDRRGLFFSLDNHLAVDGCALLGSRVAPQVQRILDLSKQSR